MVLRDTLGKRKTETARKALLKAAQDQLFIVRQAAVQGLSYFDDLDTIKSIRHALGDTAMVVRSEAVDAITKRNDKDAISLLEKELYAKHNYQKGRSVWIRPQIVHAFGKLGDPEALSILMRSLKDKDEQVVEQSCKSLQTLAMKNQWEYPVHTKDCAAAWDRWYENRNKQQTTVTGEKR
ncbi:MAG: HEAT repeat domain-containing protein [Bdellovibrionota bacterium]